MKVSSCHLLDVGTRLFNCWDETLEPTLGVVARGKLAVYDDFVCRVRCEHGFL